MLVEFGRRQALGVDPRAGARRPGGGDAKPIVDRVRADGPLLPPLTLALARWIADHYLAPPALVIRAMLPPGCSSGSSSSPSGTPAPTRHEPDGAARRRRSRPARPARAGARPVRDLAGARRARRPPTPAPGARGRRARHARLDAARRVGRAALRTLASARPPPVVRRPRALARASASPAGRSGRARSRRSRELAAAPSDGLAGPELAGRHGAVGGRRPRPPRASSRPRSRERPRRPLAARPPRPARRPTAGERPARAEQADAVARRSRRRSRRRDPTPLLLDGVTGGGKTAIYVEAIAASLEARPAGARPGARDRAGAAARRPAAGRPRRPGRARPFGPRRRRARGRVATDPGGRRRHRRRDAPGRPRAARRCRRRHRRRGARRRLQERPDAPAPGPRRRDPSSPRLAGARGRAGLARRPPVESVGRALDGRYGRVVLPTRADGRRARRSSRRHARGARGGQPRPAVATRSTTRSPRSIRRRATRRSSSSTGAGRRRSCCAATAATSRPAPTASGRSSTTRPARRCAATTAAARRRSRPAARTAARRGSATSAAARNASSARSAPRIPGLRVGRLDRDVAERRGAAERVIDAFTAGRTRRPRRHEPRRQGPRRARASRWSASCRPTSR